MADKKIELRVNTGSDFGDRYLPVTGVKNILDFLDGDDNIKAEWLPDWITGTRRYVGSVPDLEHITTLAEVYENYIEGELQTDESPVGKYVAMNHDNVFSTGSRTDPNDASITEEFVFNHVEESDRPTDQGIQLEINDILVIDKVVMESSTERKYYISVVNNTYENATTGTYGITKLSTATDSDSTTLAATPSAVKAAYDLANGKEDAFTKNSAFNKNFGTEADTVAEGDHTHDYDNYGGFFIKDSENDSFEVLSGQSVDFEPASNSALSIVSGSHKMIFDVDSSSTTIKGVIETATVAEAKSGTDTSRAITAEGLFASALPYFTSLANADAAAADYPTGKIVVVEVS